jgi:hypothetical protein
VIQLGYCQKIEAAAKTRALVRIGFDKHVVVGDRLSVIGGLSHVSTACLLFPSTPLGFLASPLFTLLVVCFYCCIVSFVTLEHRARVGRSSSIFPCFNYSTLPSTVPLVRPSLLPCAIQLCDTCILISPYLFQFRLLLYPTPDFHHAVGWMITIRHARIHDEHAVPPFAICSRPLCHREWIYGCTRNQTNKHQWNMTIFFSVSLAIH